MNSKSHAGGAYAKYIGRVGALAVALGVTGAVATTPGVAWADDASSAASADSGSTQSDPSSSASAETSSPSATVGAQESPGEADDPDSEAEPTDDPDETSETVDADGDVVEGDEAESPEDTDEDVETPDEEVVDEEVPDEAVDDEPAPVGDGDTTAAPEHDRVVDDPGPTAEAAQTPETAAAVAVSAASAESASALADSAGPTDAAVRQVQLSIPALPTPDEVVRQVRDTVTACVCGLINGTIKLVNAAMSALSGGGLAGPGGPAAPAGNPLVMAVLEWARRETTRVVEAISRTPVAQFVHQITMQVTQAVTDFGNSPLGRQISARVTQFLQQCDESTSLPGELERVAIVAGLNEPTDFAFLTDQSHADTIHRIFITEKSGAIKLYNPEDGSVTTLTNLPTVTADGERGLVGIEVDPQFWTAGAEGYHTIYVAYTGADNYDQLSKLSLAPDTLAVVGEQVLLKSTQLGNNFHHGGELQFDPAGQYLYWAVGDNTVGANAQDLSNIHGKILRLDRNGNAPADNPYFNTPGAVKQIYATGLRNPFRFTFTPNGKLLVGDVGEADWEELNIVTAGGNYGWPAEEGECTDCEYVNPVYAYPHSAPPANAGSITSVLVYTGSTLPEEYRNKVFIADYSTGWIKELTFDAEFTSLISERTFDSQAGTAVKLDQGADGNIYQLNIYPGQLSIIRPSGGNRPPAAVITASATSGAGDTLDVQFSGTNSTDPEGDSLQYRWDFGNGRTSTEANPTMQFTNTGDDFTAYTVTLTVSDGDKTDVTTQRIVVGSTPPTAEIKDTLPLKYNAGDTITFEATGSDADETLPTSAYEWTVVFHHAEHTHPFRDNIVGTTGSVTIPRTRDQLGNTWYRVTLTVTDSSGLSTTTFRDVHPNTVALTFTASDPEAAFTVDGVRYTGSHVISDAVVGVERTVSAPSPQPHSDGQLVFANWSDGGAQSHTITTPDTAAEYTVTYNVVPSSAAVVV